MSTKLDKVMNYDIVAKLDKVMDYDKRATTQKVTQLISRSYVVM